MIKLLIVAGARPNFMKIAPLIREIQKRPETFEYSLVHTGQHYDDEMSSVFFRELGIPEPNFHLNVGSGSHAAQTAKIMTMFEPICLGQNPSCVIVVGDVNSTLACSIVAKKLNYTVAHIEAGLRSGDLAMPEEINRIVTDSISDLFYVTERSGATNLLKEGKSDAQIAHVGHVMADNLLFEIDKLDTQSANDLADRIVGGQLRGRYGVVTLHRPANVDNKEVLAEIRDALNDIAAQIPLIFAVHPRTKKKLAEFDLTFSDNVHLIEPQGYRNFVQLWRFATLVLTDSGGLQEETTVLGVPCLTLRTNTERPITVDEGTNTIVGTERAVIVKAAKMILAGDARPGSIPALWDGRSAGRILDHLESNLCAAR